MYRLDWNMENVLRSLECLELENQHFLSAWQVKFIQHQEVWVLMDLMSLHQVALIKLENKSDTVLSLMQYLKVSLSWSIFKFTLLWKESDLIWKKELSKNKLKIWIYKTMLILEQTNFQVVTEENYLWRWHWLEILLWYF